MKTISSGSSGNCYIIETQNKHIILDCGLPFEKITHNELFPKFSSIEFVFCSHAHHDHNKSLKDFKKAGVDIISYETLEQKVQKHSLGNWELTTFPVKHNTPCWGIIMKNKTTSRTICYCTDFNQMPKLENVDYWIYEVNYIQERIDKQIEKSGFDKFKHTNFVFHNSLENALEYFESLKTKPKSLCVCHLSKENGSKTEILKQLRKALPNTQVNTLEQDKIINIKEKKWKEEAK